MSPADREVSPSTSSSDCSPFVETRAANRTSESEAEAFTSSTVTSLRNVISGAVAPALSVTAGT